MNKVILFSKRRSPYGSELVQNGDFATDTDWSKGVGCTISGGKLNFNVATNINTNQNAGFATGIYVELTFEVSNYVSGRVRSQVGGVFGDFINANGTYTQQALTVNGYVAFWGEVGVGFIGSIDNVSVREIL